MTTQSPSSLAVISLSLGCKPDFITEAAQSRSTCLKTNLRTFLASARRPQTSWSTTDSRAISRSPWRALVRCRTRPTSVSRRLQTSSMRHAMRRTSAASRRARPSSSVARRSASFPGRSRRLMTSSVVALRRSRSPRCTASSAPGSHRLPTRWRSMSSSRRNTAALTAAASSLTPRTRSGPSGSTTWCAGSTMRSSQPRWSAERSRARRTARKRWRRCVSRPDPRREGVQL